MRTSQNKWDRVYKGIACMLFLAISGILLVSQGTVGRSQILYPVFHAHVMRAMPIVRKLTFYQDVQPASVVRKGHKGDDIQPVPVAFPCQKVVSQTGRCYGPHQIRQAYGVNNLIARGFTGKNTKIAIIDAYGSPTIQRDLTAFNKAWGLPQATLHIITPQGQAQPDPNWGPETSLDVEWAHAMAPDAVINLVLARTSSDVDLYRTTKYAVDHDLGDVFSLSFGENESCADASLRRSEHALFAQAVQKGVTILAAAGDSGSAQIACDGTSSFQEEVSFPASDPLVTSLGGTDLKADLATGHYLSESAWNESGDFNKASGGGYSTLYQQPEYQHGVTLNKFGRAVPDLALNASVKGGVIVFMGDGVHNRSLVSVMGGTSVAAPELAGIIADAVQMAHHRLGQINSALYKLGRSQDYNQRMHDITTGNNVLTSSSVAGYPATAGWDPVTGWGTPKDALLFMQNLIASSPISGQPGEPEPTPVGGPISLTPVPTLTLPPLPTITVTPKPGSPISLPLTPTVILKKFPAPLPTATLPTGPISLPSTPPAELTPIVRGLPTPIPILRLSPTLHKPAATRDSFPSHPVLSAAAAMAELSIHQSPILVAVPKEPGPIPVPTSGVPLDMYQPGRLWHFLNQAHLFTGRSTATSGILMRIQYSILHTYHRSPPGAEKSVLRFERTTR